MRYNHDEVLNIIENTRRFGTLTGYEVSKRMLEQLGNPQSGIPFVHVAGTNGKGSTTAFLCKILEQTGKKIGMFTSPHLITFEERIRINGEYISKEDVTRLGNQLLEMDFDVSPTMFDYCLAMAVLYFKEQQCDMMVMETGIGGRYDSTNALGTPELAVITKIGLDHTSILGDTLEQIAGEKAGIIKAGCPVVTAAQQMSVMKVLLENFEQVNHIETKAVIVSTDQQRETKAVIVHTDQQWEENPGCLEMTDDPVFYEVSREDLRYAGSIPMKMQGSFQLENAATAALAAKCIFKKWIESKAIFADEAEADQDKIQNRIDSYIYSGISQTVWKGRMEIVNKNPFFMIDGAHNAHGVHALAESLAALYPGEKFHFIMAVMADKDYEEMIEELLPLAMDFITVTPESSRALQSKELAECISKKGVKARYAEDMELVIRPLLPQENSAVSVIRKDDGIVHIYLAQSEHKVIAFGSLYFIGAIEAMLEENKKND